MYVETYETSQVKVHPYVLAVNNDNNNNNNNDNSNNNDNNKNNNFI